jgi:hypothetical protein
MTNKFTKILLLITALRFELMDCKAQEIKCDYSYPAMVCGSTWGEIFQRLYKNGDFQSMLNLTSPESIKKYGQLKILTYYQEMNFGYQMSLKSWNQDERYYVLNYEANINATKVIVRITLQKGDSAKIVLASRFENQKYFLYK